MKLRGAIVAITGASAGIGRECALAFAREGASLAISARRKNRLDELAGEIKAMGRAVLVHVVDVARRDEVQAWIDDLAAKFGGVDVLVNNAGYGVYGRVEDTPAEAYERLMRVNFLGTVYGCQAVVPIMKRQGGGTIINVSSVVGHRAMPGGGAYAATKAAQISLSESLRVELRGTGVNVCTVHPIGTVTEFHEVLARESGGRSVGFIGPRQSAADVARAIVRCARRPRAEVYPHALSRALVWLNALAPGLTDWLAERGARRAGRL